MEPITRHNILVPKLSDIVKIASSDLRQMAASISAAIGQGTDEARALAAKDTQAAIVKAKDDFATFITDNGNGTVTVASAGGLTVTDGPGMATIGV